MSQPIYMFICGAFALLTAFPCDAQKIKFIQFTTRDGLPSNECYNLWQDKKGYIWAATDYGVVKHNGERFVPVCTNIPFNESIILAVDQDREGNFYFANSRRNVYRIRNDSAYSIDEGHIVSKTLKEGDYIFGLTVIDSATIYIQTRRNAYLYLPYERTLRNLKSEADKLPYEYILKEIYPGRFIYLYGDPPKQGLFIKGLREEKIYSTQKNLMLSARRRPVMLGNRLNLLYYSGILQLDNYGRTSYREMGNVIVLKPGNDGKMWAGSNGGGLMELDTGAHVLHRYLEDKSVSDVLTDNENGLWVSTLDNGVFYCPNIFIRHYEIPGGISMLRRAGSRIFAGTQNGALFDCKDGLSEIANVPPHTFTDVIALRDEYVFATKQGTGSLDAAGKFHLAKERNSAATLRDLAYDLVPVKGDTFLHVSYSRLSLIAADSVLKEFFFDTRILCAVQRAGGELLVGSVSGLYSCDMESAAVPAYLSALKNYTVNRLLTDARNNVWICTKGEGIYVLTPQNRLVKLANIPSLIVNDLCFPNRYSILAATGTGLYFNTFAGLRQNASWHNLYREEITHVDMLAGKIYFSSRNELIVFDKKLIRAPQRHAYYFHSAVAGNKTFRAGEDIRLDSRQNNIFFHFDFLDFSDFRKMFMYSLQGPSSANGIAEGTQLHLQNLSPGSYTLSVTPLSERGYEPESTLLLRFYIQPALWQTPAFRFIMIALAACGIALLVRSYYKRKQREENRKNAINQLLSEYKLTALKSQINPHFISNSLSAIQQLIQSNADKAGLYIAKFSLFIRYVLKYSDRSCAPLSDELKIARLNIELEQLRFNHHFIFDVDVDPDIDPEDFFIPTLITQPFLENAVWHGLIPLKERQPRLLFRARLDKGSLVLSIIDNGVGRKKIKQDSGQDTIFESRGISLTQHRIEMINQLYSGYARIDFTDLHDESGNPAGTQVDIVFPSNIITNLYEKYHNEPGSG